MNISLQSGASTTIQYIMLQACLLNIAKTFSLNKPTTTFRTIVSSLQLSCSLFSRVPKRIRPQSTTTEMNVVGLCFSSSYIILRRAFLIFFGKRIVVVVGRVAMRVVLGRLLLRQSGSCVQYIKLLTITASHCG